MTDNRLKDGERCADCEKILDSGEELGGGSPREPYEDGFHICGKGNKEFKPIVSMSEVRRLEVTNEKKLSEKYGELKREYDKLKESVESTDKLIGEADALIGEIMSYADKLARPESNGWKKWLRRAEEWRGKC